MMFMNGIKYTASIMMIIKLLFISLIIDNYQTAY